MSHTDRQVEIDQIIAEFSQELRENRHPTINAFCQRYPAMSEEIQELLPAALVLEKSKNLTCGNRWKIPTLSQIGEFRIVRELARGGMGIVFLAEQDSLERQVAIKLFPHNALLNQRELERFKREAKIIARLHHNNIISIIGVGQQNGFHYYAMPYVDGISLDRLVPAIPLNANLDSINLPAITHKLLDRPAGNGKSTDDLSTGNPQSSSRDSRGSADDSAAWVNSNGGTDYGKAVANIGIQVAQAIGYAHRNGVLHRDIKPSNLIIQQNGKVWVTDFGIAKQFDDHGLSLTGDIVGTRQYMAPEQVQGKASERSDVFCLGLTLYELLARRPARTGTQDQELWHKSEIRSLRRVCPEIPTDLATIVMKAVAIEPDQRYSSADELAEELKRFCDGLAIQAKKATAVEQFIKWCRRNPNVALLSTLAATLLIALLTVTTSKYRQEIRQRQKIESALATSFEAFEKVYEQLTPVRLPGIPLSATDYQSLELDNRRIISKSTAALLEEMLDYYKRLANLNGDNVQLRTEIAHATRRVGEIHKQLGNWQAASDAFHGAIIKYDELLHSDYRDGPQIDIAVLTRDKALCCRAIGEIHRMRHKVGESDRSYLRAISLLNLIFTAARSLPPETVIEIEFEIGTTLGLLGQRPRRSPCKPPRRRDPPTLDERPRALLVPPPQHLIAQSLPRHPEDLAAGSALESWQRDAYLSQSIEILRKLRSDFPDSPNYTNMLALVYLGKSRNLGDCWQTESIELARELTAKYPDNERFLFNLCEALAIADVPRLPPEKFPTAIGQLRQALEFANRLNNSNVQFNAMVIHTNHKLASLLLKYSFVDAQPKRSRHLRQAGRHCREAIRIHEEIPRPESNWNRLWGATFRTTLSEILLAQADPKSLSDAKQLLSENQLSLVKMQPVNELKTACRFVMRRTSDLMRQVNSAIQRRRNTTEQAPANASAERRTSPPSR